MFQGLNLEDQAHMDPGHLVSRLLDDDDGGHSQSSSQIKKEIKVDNDSLKHVFKQLSQLDNTCVDRSCHSL